MAKYDVVKDYDWTSIPRGSPLRKKAPRVWVKSFKLKSNQIMQAIQGFMNIYNNSGGSDDAKSFYDKMYSDSTIPEDDFNFPFFSDGVRSFSNTFGDTFQSGTGGSGGIGASLFEGAKELAGGVASLMGVVGSEALSKAKDQFTKGNLMEAGKTVVGGALKGGNPGTYIETPMFYQFEKNDGPLEVRFMLANTINNDSLDQNHNLIQRLTYINRPLRKNSIAVDPPRIYQVKVPGHRFIRWAFCNSFSVNMMGTRRNIDNVIVPEFYDINMSFQSLTLEHAGFMKEAAQ